MPADPPSTASRSAPRDEHPDAPSLAAYASGRGLHHTPTGLLAPATRRLRLGLGAGTHRSALADRPEGHFTWMGAVPPRRRAERATHELCSGILPGGLDGLVAHHRHLQHDGTPDGGRAWRAWPTTLVFAQLPAGARAGCDIAASKQTGGPAGALLTVGRPGAAPDPLRTVVAPGATQVERAGVSWSIAPAEDPAAVDALVNGASEALAAGPADLQVEVEFGALCVWVPRAVSDPAALDALCRAASAVAEGVRAAAAVHDPLVADAPVAPPAATERSRWIDAGVALVDWPSPPESVAAARAAYERLVARGARRRGRGLAAAVVALTLAVGGAALAVGLATGYAYGGVVTAAISLWVVVKVVRHGVSLAGELADDEVAARARPWGMEAFWRGFTAARGLTPEDADTLRRAYDSPLRGRPLKAAHGRLPGGAAGHVALWLDPGAGGPDRHWLVVLVAARGEAPAVPAPYRADVRSGVLTVAVEVREDERGADRLDELCRVASRVA